MRSLVITLLALLVLAAPAPAAAQRPSTWRCAHVLAEDGQSWRRDVVVTTLLDRIISVAPATPDQVVDRDFGEAYMVPGLIDLHTHLLLRPYDQRSWDDQVLLDSLELRTLRAGRYAQDTLLAGFVAVRDLGTEGAGYADVALWTAIGESTIRGPRIYPSTRAIVQRGRYGPEPDDPAVRKGAQPVTGIDEIRQAVREQVAGGAAWIKVYADYRYGPGGEVSPTFSLEELQALCAEAQVLDRPVAAHATTDEGVRRAVLAGVRTIEHGGGASAATLELMRERSVVLCPCLAANEAIVGYTGLTGRNVGRLEAARAGFQRALAAGVEIACGSDAGVFMHGSNARELQLMVEYGMSPEHALAAATSIAARVLGNPDLGTIRAGAACGLVVLLGDPLLDITSLSRVIAVVREGDELGGVR